MKKIILSCVFCIIAIANGFSQTKQESIKELFHIMETDSMTQRMFSSMTPPILNLMQLKDSASQALFKEKMNTVKKVTAEITTKMLDEMVVLYDKHFSQEEITDFISFYRTPSGYKWIKETPQIQSELMTVMMQKYMPEMQKALLKMNEQNK